KFKNKSKAEVKYEIVENDKIKAKVNTLTKIKNGFLNLKEINEAIDDGQKYPQ
ncbi:MAG: hypothetical protein IE890_09910, partial [Arcobacter sp.]|nr:hypothetical protein [Arcobacter sp.]